MEVLVSVQGAKKTLQGPFVQGGLFFGTEQRVVREGDRLGDALGDVQEHFGKCLGPRGDVDPDFGRGFRRRGRLLAGTTGKDRKGSTDGRQTETEERFHAPGPLFGVSDGRASVHHCQYTLRREKPLPMTLKVFSKMTKASGSRVKISSSSFFCCTLLTTVMTTCLGRPV